ncbi:hypothetical protein KZZ07_24100 [Mameliella sp. CS4]|uniref:hypothetical protein n=1 Tax=Mameliella sp. CS4 TaxID=2862329 RepID=UPI001C5E39E7|nr:hypothetical protein [Mameliella sp. CS4]MBW4985629.1 hypothetical protein [Mameliella sp. CS4]
MRASLSKKFFAASAKVENEKLNIIQFHVLAISISEMKKLFKKIARLGLLADIE